MQLYEVRSHRVYAVKNRIVGCIDEQGDDAHAATQLVGNRTRLVTRNMARRARVEHKASKVGTGTHRCERIVRARQAADFDFDRH